MIEHPPGQSDPKPRLIPESEIEWGKPAKAGGPGGQNVNKRNTKAELRFNLDGTPRLTEEQKQRIRMWPGVKVTSEGYISMQSKGQRTYEDNQREAVERFYKILDEALHVQAKREPTRPTEGSIDRRLDQKTKHGGKKADRQWRYQGE